MTSEVEACAVCGKQLPIVLYREHPDGKKEGLCRTDANRWLLSEEEWPPQKKNKNQAKTSTQSTSKIVK